MNATASSLAVKQSGFVLGVHAPAMTIVGDGREVNPYVSGSLKRLLQFYGVTSANGAVAHCKLRDLNLSWTKGEAPPIPPSMKVFLKEARELGFKTLVAYIPPDAWNKTLSDAKGLTSYGLQLRQAATATAKALGYLADVMLAGNEYEDLVADSHNIECLRLYWDFERICFKAWRVMSKEVAVGADMSAVNFVQHLKERATFWPELPKAFAYHAYGEGGEMPEHVALLLEAVRAKMLAAGFKAKELDEVEHWFTECAIGFEGLAIPMGTKDYVWDERHGEWMDAMGRAFIRSKARMVFFAQRQLVNLEGTGPSPAAEGIKRALYGDSREEPACPSLAPRKAESKTYRLQVEIQEETPK